jgi:hypothetical protein
LPLPGREHQLLGLPARSLVAIPTELSKIFLKILRILSAIAILNISKKCYALVDTGQWALKGNTTVSRGFEFLNAVIPIIFEFFPCPLMFLTLLGSAV